MNAGKTLWVYFDLELLKVTWGHFVHLQNLNNSQIVFQAAGGGPHKSLLEIFRTLTFPFRRIFIRKFQTYSWKLASGLVPFL